MGKHVCTASRRPSAARKPREHRGQSRQPRVKILPTPIETHFESRTGNTGIQNPQRNTKMPSNPRSSIHRGRRSISIWDHQSISTWDRRSTSCWDYRGSAPGIIVSLSLEIAGATTSGIAESTSAGTTRASAGSTAPYGVTGSSLSESQEHQLSHTARGWRVDTARFTRGRTSCCS